MARRPRLLPSANGPVQWLRSPSSREFLARRGHAPSVGIGAKEVRKWARSLARGSSVIDLGCGPGFPITAVLVDEGLDVFAVDAAPSFVAAFQRKLPGTPIICDAVPGVGVIWSDFRCCLGMGADLPSRRRRSTSPDPEIRRRPRAGWPSAIHLAGPARRLERRHDRPGIALLSVPGNTVNCSKPSAYR